MKFLPNYTLAYFQAAPQVVARAVSDLPVSVLSKSTQQYHEDCGLSYPDRDAAAFYGLNHCASIVKEKFTANEPLPPWARNTMHAYLDAVVSQSERLTHYMVAIITREARHLLDLVAMKTVLLELFDTETYAFLRKLKSSGEDKAVSLFEKHPPDISLHTYVSAIAHIFNNGKWAGGYGGKPWGLVATTLLSMLEGHTTMEVMVDTAYTLAHNNGPIFNKGMMYHQYSHEFIRLLDIQRSGQIPNLYMEDGPCVSAKYLESHVRELIQGVKDANPEAFGSFVDWVKVRDAGALQSCESMIKQQKAKYPESVISLFMGKPATPKGTFEISPSLWVPVFERKVAA